MIEPRPYHRTEPYESARGTNSRTGRFQVSFLVSPEMLKRIKAYEKASAALSFSEAVRSLVQRGLEVER